MFSISHEQLTQITELARLFYTPAEVCTIQEIPPEVFKAHMASAESAVYKAYWRGWYESDVEFRKEVKRIALLGSSPAQTLLGDIISGAKMKMIDT